MGRTGLPGKRVPSISNLNCVSGFCESGSAEVTWVSKGAKKIGFG